MSRDVHENMERPTKHQEVWLFANEPDQQKYHPKNNKTVGEVVEGMYKLRNRFRSWMLTGSPIWVRKKPKPCRHRVYAKRKKIRSNTKEKSNPKILAATAAEQYAAVEPMRNNIHIAFSKDYSIYSALSRHSLFFPKNFYHSFFSRAFLAASRCASCLERPSPSATSSPSRNTPATKRRS